MALIVPNTDANAGKAASSVSKIMIAIDRFNIFDFPRRDLRQGPCCALVKQQTGLTPERKYLQRSSETAGPMAALFVTSFEAEKMRDKA
jgi:hypothetical protein